MVPPWLSDAYNLLLGTFTGAVRVTFFAILVLFLSKMLFDMLQDWLFYHVKKYLNYIFLPGAFFHQLFHTLAIKMLGYQVKVKFLMSFSFRDVSSQTFSGELKNIWHAFIIGYSPILNFATVIVLIQFHPEMKQFFYSVNFHPYGDWLIIYLIVSLIYFGLPDFGDLTLPFTTATAKHAEIIFLLFAGFICYVIAVAVWGWLIPTINFFLYCIVLIYLTQKKEFAEKKIVTTDFK